MTHRSVSSVVSFLVLPVVFWAGCGPELAPPELASAEVERADPIESALWGDRQLEALFTPDDDPIEVEVALIRSIIDERASDPATYTFADNPYRVRYAVYNLRNADVVDALVDARDAGVAVQVLLEDSQLDPARDWNWADDHLVASGFGFAPDHRDLSEEARRTTELIGIGGSGLMHLKLRLFQSPTRHLAVSGSMNPGDNAVNNDETWHLVRHPELVSLYADGYDRLLLEQGFHNAWSDERGANVLFTPTDEGPEAGDRILQWVAEEDEQILLMVYSLRDITSPERTDSLVAILADRVAAGVPVILVTDRKQSDSWGDTTEDRLRDVGVRVYEATNEAGEFNAMHHKVAILGRTDVRVITDAANWSTSGLGSARTRAKNVESSLFIEPSFDGGHLGRRYLAQALRVLERYAAQSADDGEAPFADLAPLLWEHPDWPRQPVTFYAHEARTIWGEQIRVLGDDPELGMWGKEGAGVALSTDASIYPSWTGGPAFLPVGRPVEYKLVAEQSGGIRWENGDNRSFTVLAPPFGDGELIVESPWR